MPQAEFPILEFDPNPEAILNPHSSKTIRIPEQVVLCFFNEVLKKKAEDGELTVIANLSSEYGTNPIYRMSTPTGDITVVHPGVGAPMAVAFMEELIALGGRKFIACGGVGVLVKEIAVGHPVVLTSAVRDEGTSYHYLPPSRESYAHPAAVQALTSVLSSTGLSFLTGKAWTTDAFYRETPAKRDQRVAEGCLVVDMEASAFFAVAQFRGVIFGQVVYGGDLVVPEGWDYRGWDDRTDDRKLLLNLSVQAVQQL